ncbi:hypothetical protein ABIA32_000198 [Streptacidiphilus sp. MAP12-20]
MSERESGQAVRVPGYVASYWFVPVYRPGLDGRAVAGRLPGPEDEWAEVEEIESDGCGEG